MLERLYDYLENETPISLICSCAPFFIRVQDTIIADIEDIAQGTRVYFNDEDYVILKPEEYEMSENDDSIFYRENGDYIQLLDGDNLC